MHLELTGAGLDLGERGTVDDGTLAPHLPEHCGKSEQSSGNADGRGRDGQTTATQGCQDT